MTPLALPLTALLLCVCGIFVLQHQRCAVRMPSPGKVFPVVLMSTLILPAMTLYGQLGRYGDWDQGNVDHRVGYLLQKTINEDRLALDANPNSPERYLKLARSHAAGGQYEQAVTVMDQLLALTTPQPAWLGLKASYLYYRDGRAFGEDARALVEQALALDSADVSTRMFLANQAYLSGRYEEAIGHWQVLLTSNKDDVNRAAIGNAISRAQARLVEAP
ncbi:formate-dependent nitrite reductase, NrfG protein [Ferrimonas balearica DSM 9799]|uniref:Formate-dependent nitrite reductase, NrfG protein n=2 Tax=Ferrimonas balearica TaxID=44012 RepID=E1SRD0_FERBD|nr:formate-dependent nitrite reductase, NrfG protein [Ferrimonas balearica DSM 9799]MBW3138773.1 nitrite reductase [Ferrimonas balearica]MBW3163618.1 nitrite reductase [Ferrimonas balearica]MBY5979566.1 nitrite reductase [Ferrimonas balearica]MBY6105836.1 nitrite reductase [Ferrimonas balearica]